jgi:hypothetical protein
MLTSIEIAHSQQAFHHKMECRSAAMKVASIIAAFWRGSNQQD